MFDDDIFGTWIVPPVELEFRDGTRSVPRYLADLMGGIETHRLTYQEAVDAANKRTMDDLLNAKQASVLAAHFREHR